MASRMKTNELNVAILLLHQTATQLSRAGRRVSLELVKLIFGLEVQCEEIHPSTVSRGCRGKLLLFVPSPGSGTLIIT